MQDLTAPYEHQIYRTEGTGGRSSALRIVWAHLGSPGLLRLVLFEHLLGNDGNRILHLAHRHFGKVGGACACACALSSRYV